MNNSSRFPLNKLAFALQVVIASSCIFSLETIGADGEWIISPPTLFTNPEKIRLADTFVDTGGTIDNNGNYPSLKGSVDHLDIINLYNQGVIDTVEGNEGNVLIVNNNVFGFDNNPVINIDKELNGIEIRNKTIWSFAEREQFDNYDKAAIYIESAEGRLTGSIVNSGNIKGGVYIAGSASPVNGAVYESQGDKNVNTGKATLEGGFHVMDGGEAVSISNNQHAIDIKDSSYVDNIEVDVRGSLIAKGLDAHAIYVKEGGQLGGSISFEHGTDTMQSVPSIVSATNILIPVWGIGDSDNLEGNDNYDRYQFVDFDGDGNPDDSDNDGNPDLYRVIEEVLPTGVSGSVNLNEGDTVVHVKGLIQSEQGNAIKIDGEASGQIKIARGGQLKGGLSMMSGATASYGKAAIAIGELNGNSGAITNFTGTIDNEGSIEGGVFIAGKQNAINEANLYRSSGSESVPSVLSGGYNLINGGQATSSIGNGVHVGNYSVIDKIAIEGVGVTGEGGKLISGAGNAIYIEQTAMVGGVTSPSVGPVVSVKDGGMLEATDITKAAIVVNGNLNGYVGLDNGTITGGIRVGVSGQLGDVSADANAYGLLLENGSFMGISNGSSGSVIKSEGSFYGSIAVKDSAITASGGTAIDFSNSQTGLVFKQTGESASTTGSIIGSSINTNDTVDIMDGTFNGGTLIDIDELVISTNSTINITGDFTLPTKTTIQIEEDFNEANTIINLTGTLRANDSQLLIKPSSLESYKELVSSPKTLVIAESGSVNSATDAEIITKIDGIMSSYISNTGVLLEVSNAVINGAKLEVMVTAADPSSFAHSLIKESLTETEAMLLSSAMQAMVSPQSVDQQKANALFSSLNSTDDFKQLATEVAQPLDITARAGLGVMNTAQNITLSESAGQRNGFSYGDGFGFGESWGQVIYSESSHSSVSGVAGYKGKTNGYILGAGLHLTDDWLLGLSGAITNTVINGKQKSDMKVNSYIGSIYSNWSKGNWFFDSLLTVGLTNNDTQKYIGIQKVEADYNSTLWGARFVAGHQFMVNNWGFIPQIELNYGHIGVEKYRERGDSGWESMVNPSNYEVMEFGGGFRANYSYLLTDGSIRPELSVMGYYDTKNKGSQFEASYIAGGNPFIVTEAERDRFRIQGAVGVSVDLLDSWTLDAVYNLNLSHHYKSHSVSAKAKYSF